MRGPQRIDPLAFHSIMHPRLIPRCFNSDRAHFPGPTIKVAVIQAFPLSRPSPHCRSAIWGDAIESYRSKSRPIHSSDEFNKKVNVITSRSIWRVQWFFQGCRPFGKSLWCLHPEQEIGKNCLSEVAIIRQQAWGAVKSKSARRLMGMQRASRNVAAWKFLGMGKPCILLLQNKKKSMQSPCPHSNMRPLLGQASAQLFSPPARVAPATLVHHEEHVMTSQWKTNKESLGQSCRDILSVEESNVVFHVLLRIHLKKTCPPQCCNLHL